MYLPYLTYWIQIISYLGKSQTENVQSGGFPGAGLKTTDLDQYFSNLSWGPPITPHFVCLPHLTHMIQLISSLVETTRPEVGVLD